MLISDEVHDNKIVENVKAMQKNCSGMLHELSASVERLCESSTELRERGVEPEVDDAPRRSGCHSNDDKEYERAVDPGNDDPARLLAEMELQRLKSLMADSVPRADFDSKCSELSSCTEQQRKMQEELAALRVRISEMVPAAEHGAARESLKACQSELERLKSALSQMEDAQASSKLQDTKPTDDVDRLNAELDRLQLRLQAKDQEVINCQILLQKASNECQAEDRVSQAELDRKCEEALGLAAEVDRLKTEVDRLQLLLKEKDQEVTSAQKQLHEGGKAIEELLSLKTFICTMVPKAKYDAAQDSLRMSEMEVDRLKALVESSVPKVQLDTKCDEAEDLAGQVNRLQAELGRLQSSLEVFKGAQDEVSNLRQRADRAARAEEELSALKSALQGMVPKAKLDAAHDSLRLCEMELERIKTLLQGSVPKVKYDMTCDEVTRGEAEMAKLQSQLERLKSNQDSMEDLRRQLDEYRRQFEECRTSCSEKDVKLQLQDQDLARFETQVSALILLTPFCPLCPSVLVEWKSLWPTSARALRVRCGGWCVE